MVLYQLFTSVNNQRHNLILNVSELILKATIYVAYGCMQVPMCRPTSLCKLGLPVDIQNLGLHVFTLVCEVSECKSIVLFNHSKLFQLNRLHS
jgi:hypothetical protein